MTALEQADNVGPKRDRYGRYLIPDPVTGQEKAWTRATTLADTLDDRYNLELWKLRTCAVGLATRKDLLALVAAHKDDKQQLNRVCGDALEAGKASEGANLGTALHALTEQLDRGESPLILDELRPDVDAYTATMAAAGLGAATLPDGRLGREVILVCPELEVAGTADHILDGDTWTIGDLKTGASAIAWAMGSIAIQLSIYAHATHYYDPATGVIAEMPPRNLDKAVVIHLPVGQATCTLHDVDIAAGWEAAQQALWVRGWRKRKGLSKPIDVKVVTPAPADEDAAFDGLDRTDHVDTIAAVKNERPADLREHLQRRAAALKNIDGAAQRLLAMWPKGVPSLKSGEFTTEQLEQLDTVVSAVEAEFEATFVTGPVSEREKADNAAIAATQRTLESATKSLEEAFPGATVEPPTPIDEGDAADAKDIAAVETKRLALAPEPKAWVAKCGRDMKTCGRPLQLKAQPTRRRLLIAQALVAWAGFCDSDGDEIIRAALGHVIGEDIVAVGAPTGELFALLRVNEAERMLRLATELEAGDVMLRYRDDSTPFIEAA